MQIVHTAEPRRFHFSASFLAPYYAKGDPFKTLLARSTYVTKYARDREQWTDTIRRVVEGNMALSHVPVGEHEAELLFHLFWTGQALPPGRGLWTGGVPGIPADARFNCFSKETQFWANGRLVTFEEAVGETVEVLCADGQWRPAEVKSFGKQVLRTIRLAAPGRSNFAFEFTATPNHRWITNNRGTVDDLKVGDRILVTPRQVNKGSQLHADGFTHGFVFGDGSKDKLRDHKYRARLCADKDRLHEATFTSSSYFTSSSTPPSFNGDPLLFFTSDRNLKAVPDDAAPVEYQAGFLAGWLAADGSLRSDGRGGNRLSSINAEALQWAVDRAPLLGYCVTGYSTLSNMETPYGPRSAPLNQVTFTHNPVEYTVRSITDEGREEEVFCAVEPETHTFTLAGGVPTGNCWYTTLYSGEDWCWMMNQLMLGGGVGIGLGEIDKLPVVAASNARFAVNCVDHHSDFLEVKPNDKHFLNGQTPVYHAEDSRAGWVESLRRVLAAAWTNKDLIVDVSNIRPRGMPIKTFGGIACGPGPLTHLLRSVWEIVRGASGRKLTSVECLDITNMIGFCVKSGNVRRSALIALGDAEDQPFRDAKKDNAKVMSHRHTSNNSIIFRSWEQIKNFDWKALVHDNIDFGEPGIFNLPLVWETDPGAKGVNPCLTADTRVATQFGLVRIGDLARSYHALRVTTDARVQVDYRVEIEGSRASIDHQNPMVIRDAAPAFKTSDAEEVYRLTTSHGYTIKATKYHKFPTPDGFVELQNLAVGDSLLLQSGEGQWGTDGDEELGHIIGWIEGDGNFSTDSKATLRFWGEQKAQAEALLSSCQKLASTIPAENGREYSLSIVQVPSRDSCEITSERLYKALAEMGYREKGAVPEIIWRGSRNCVRGYLRGLFATDGQVQWSRDKQSFSIRLSQSNPGLLREVQTLLLNFGIVSSVYKRRDAGMRRMPDGKGGMKDYWCEDQFDLVVAKQNAVHFANKISFLLPTHATLYNEWKAAWVRGPYAETYTDEIRSIDFVGVEPVFCTTQPSHHTFIADGIVTGNCGEQALHDREACNLGENFPANFESGTNADTAFRLQVRYCMRQRLTPLTDVQSHEVGLKNMRIGVALGGLCDFDWTPDMLSGWYRTCREEANDYADELGVNRPITVTTVKPSGTISLLNGSSPGIHSPFAPFYIRRARIAKNDPMAPAMMDAGVPYELDQYDNTGNTLVFSFPMKARHTRTTVQTENIRDQFERQALVQKYWADNAVSSTLSFDPDTEREETAELLEKYVPQFKSTSMLAKRHGYVQAPYEAIDELKFHELAAQIQHDHPLVRGGEFEVEECASGACPIR